MNFVDDLQRVYGKNKKENDNPMWINGRTILNIRLTLTAEFGSGLNNNYRRNIML